MNPLLTLVTPTIGRVDEPAALLASLARAEDHERFEVVIVDQNPPGETTDAVAGLVEAYGSSLQIEHVRTPAESGASKARNRGLERVRTPWVAFPDDDSVYPPELIARLLTIASDPTSPDGVTFRCEVEPGRPARDLRWDAETGPVTIANVWRRGGLAHTFCARTELVRTAGGFDERLGPPTCSGEDTELIMRLVHAGARVVYDPTLVEYHPENLPDADSVEKAQRYGFGLGRVLATHDPRALARARVLMAPFVRSLLAMVRGDVGRARVERAILRGRRAGLRSPMVPVWGEAD